MSDYDRDIPADEIPLKPLSEEPDDGDEEVQDDEVALEESELSIRKRIPGRRLDKYLAHRFPRVSRTLMQRLIKEGEVTVNGKKTKCSYEPAEGDRVVVRVPPPMPVELTPEDIPLDILFEDKYLIAINKQTGIICHPAKAWQSGTIANAVAFHANGQLSKGTASYRPGIVHRLDKNTSGVMLIAKDDEAHWRLSRMFEERTVQKTYFGITEGEPTLDGDIIDQPLSAHPMIRDRYMLPGFPARQMLFKEAVTRYRVVERFRGFAIVHMAPKTGRTHQLRVHMSAIGHPLLGDTMYGGHLMTEKDLAGSGDESEPLIPFQSLHAMAIEFEHPIKGKPMKIEAPLPPRLERIVGLLREHRSK